MTRPTRASLNEQKIRLVAELKEQAEEIRRLTLEEGLRVYCDCCKNRIRIPGGLVFSPPNSRGMTQKFHVCTGCWGLVLHVVRKK
jgi:hypothetical protein